MTSILANIKKKSISDILGGLIDYTSTHTSEITDFTPGSIIRSIYEAEAMELEQLYTLSIENILWGIRHSVLDAFGFTPNDATAAFGYVTVTLSTPLAAPLVLAKGTSFYSSKDTESIMFVTQDSYFIDKGTSSFQVVVYCTQLGTIGNIDSNYIDTMSSTQITSKTATNEEPFATGTDEESTDSVLKRFRQFVATRGRATVNAVDYAARSVPGVTGVYVYEDTGEFIVYAHDANGDLNPYMMNQVTNAVNLYRPVGIPWSVSPVIKLVKGITFEIAVTDSTLVDDRFQTGLAEYVKKYLQSFTAGQDLVQNELTKYIMGYSTIISDVYYDDSTTNGVDDMDTANGGSGKIVATDTLPNQIIRPGEVIIASCIQGNFNTDLDIG
jgi:hypothetical protein